MTGFNSNKKSQIRITAPKQAIAFVLVLVFVFGFMPTVPENVYGANGNSDEYGKYAEGEVVVSFVDCDDMKLTAGQEKKCNRLLSEADTIMEADKVELSDTNIEESDLKKSVIEEQSVDETIALVESDTKSTKELMAELAALPNVDIVEPNYILSVTDDTPEGSGDNATEASSLSEETVTEKEEAETLGDTGAPEEPALSEGEAADGDNLYDYTGEQWAFNGVYGTNVPGWNREDGKGNAEGTVVAVMDTGVDYNHPDLKNVMWTNESENLKANGFGKYGLNLSSDSEQGRDNPMDNSTGTKGSHGTHCAGIIAAQWGNGGISGAADGTRIMAIKIADSKGSLYLSTAIKGYSKLKYAKSEGVNIVAVNNSWGGCIGGASGSNLDAAVREAGKMGIVSVFASSNENNDCDETYDSEYGPLKYVSGYLIDNEYAITVNSIDKNGNKAKSSNYGAKTTNLGAPGVDILSTIRTEETLDSQDIYGLMSGTSMATPAVSGEVAIVYAGHDNVSADVVASIVKTNTKAVADMEGRCTSGGVASTEKALEAVSAELYDIKYQKIYMSGTNLVYNGKKQRPEIRMGDLKEDTDFRIAEEGGNYTDAGNYSLTIEGTGKYKGSKTVEYSITKAGLKVDSESGDFYYNGRDKKSELKVYNAAGKKLKNNVDYKLSGADKAVIPGKYTVLVEPLTGTENYKSSTAGFKIKIRKAGIKKLYRCKRAFAVKVYKQASSAVSGYQVRYSLKQDMSRSKIKTIGTGYNRVYCKVKNLKKQRNYYVQTRAYKKIGKTKYYSDWSGVKKIRTR